MKHPVARIVGDEGDAGAAVQDQHRLICMALRQVQRLDIQRLKGITCKWIGRVWFEVDQIEDLGLAALGLAMSGGKPPCVRFPARRRRWFSRKNSAGAAGMRR
ncbi:hypothetical protein EV129_119102 [Rhizobium azibense]|uniref:Uncharacterized protein n=1 Tax=Rhizobium azibense TaxID=1136135 RepID=A0A4V2VDG0_9HYPH|nr:hypothetical protein [Rhizobium azibense]TCU32655.1 hypothetical protein EV129_119102 [Rhizobium azibense]